MARARTALAAAAPAKQRRMQQRLVAEIALHASSWEKGELRFVVGF
jgi:hypothetical protein